MSLSAFIITASEQVCSMEWFILLLTIIFTVLSPILFTALLSLRKAFFCPQIRYIDGM